jgi:dienelactone hydrolase
LKTSMLVTLLAARFALHAQPALPAPRGPFAVGRTSFFWTDKSRLEDPPAAKEPRVVAAFFYYPAIANGERAEYFPGLAGLASAPETEMLRRQFGGAWPDVSAGKVRVNAYANAPIVTSRRKLPILVFSPGASVPVLAYSIQLEDLASRGYVVIALEHGSDAALIVKPDRTLIPFVNRSPPEAGPPTVAGIEAGRAEVIRRTTDTRFALDQIARLSQQPGTMFYRRLDLSRIGVFGHSLGGKAAVRVCQADPRFRACLNQDGEMFNIPFGSSEPIPTVIAGEGTKAPVTVIVVAEPGFTDAQLAAVKVTRKQFEDWRSAKAEALHGFLEKNREPSYLITIRRPGYSHGSFMDIRQLGAAPDTQASANLQMGVDFTLWFFDAQLRNNKQMWNQFVAKARDGVSVESLGDRRAR